MLVFHELRAAASFAPPCGLLIGSFDGVHAGHSTLIQALRKQIGPDGTVAVITFSNHPSTILPGRAPTCALTSSEVKIQLLEAESVNLVYLLPFTEELSNQSYQEFLKNVQAVFPFTHLLFGKGDVIGKNREGDEKHLKALEKTMHFQVCYLEKKMIGSQMVSSSLIRSLLAKGALNEVAILLNRPFSFTAILEKSAERLIALPTAANQCMPPAGRYEIELIGSGWQERAQATFEASNKKIYIDCTCTISTPTSVEILF